MKMFSLVWFLSLCSIQLVSPKTPKINLCCRKDHAYKVKDKMREKPRCDLSFTVRFLTREVSRESTNDYISVSSGPMLTFEKEAVVFFIILVLLCALLYTVTLKTIIVG